MGYNDNRSAVRQDRARRSQPYKALAKGRRSTAPPELRGEQDAYRARFAKPLDLVTVTSPGARIYDINGNYPDTFHIPRALKEKKIKA
jgi:hypothetical protein